MSSAKNEKIEAAISGSADCNGDELQTELDSELEEKLHFIKILKTFRFYKQYVYRKICKAEVDFKSIPQQQQDLVPNFLEAMKQMRECTHVNTSFLDKVTEGADADMFNLGQRDDVEEIQAKYARKLQITSQDMDKLLSTLKQIVRDWAQEGKPERDACYLPVINGIQEHFKERRADVRILVPGAGLGRLAWELASLGYICQGNEWSLHMLLTSFFILNKCNQPYSHALYPWVNQTNNVKCREDQFVRVQFPDVDPSQLPAGSNFSMVAGDFLEVYREPASWDCVATVFFIDTAHNVLEYLAVIWDILKPGGLWINLGPLLYHYSGEPHQVSIDLSYSELRHAIVKMGFQFLNENFDVSTSYTENPHSLLKYQYNCAFFTCVKP